MEEIINKILIENDNCIIFDPIDEMKENFYTIGIYNKENNVLMFIECQTDFHLLELN